jgi:hypothetical protein
MPKKDATQSLTDLISNLCVAGAKAAQKASVPQISQLLESSANALGEVRRAEAEVIGANKKKFIGRPPSSESKLDEYGKRPANPSLKWWSIVGRLMAAAKKDGKEITREEAIRQVIAKRPEAKQYLAPEIANPATDEESAVEEAVN